MVSTITNMSNINIANFLSILRIFLCIPLIICFENIHVDYYKYCSILIIFLIVISDVLDGYFARRNNVVTNLGKIIDPVADKVCLMTVLVYLIDKHEIPFLIFFILLSIRDIVLLLFSLYFVLFKDFVPQANKIGKFFISICTLMIISFLYDFTIIVSQMLYVLSLFMLVLSTISYIKEHLERLKS